MKGVKARAGASVSRRAVPVVAGGVWIVVSAARASAAVVATSVPTPVALPPADPGRQLPAANEWMTWGVLILAAALVVVLWFTDILRPGALVRRGVRRVESAPWWVWLAAGVLVYVTAAFAGSLTNAALGIPWFVSPPLKAQVVVQVAATVAGIAAGVAMVRMLRAGTGPAPDGLSLRWSDSAVGLWCFVVGYPIILAVSQLSVWAVKALSGRQPDALAHDTLKEIAGNSEDPWVWGLRITAVLLVPAFEELIYRVGFQSAILRATGKPWAAVVGASAIFTAAHSNVMPWHALAVIAALSLAIGLAYERTKRLGVPIVMHALFNAVNVAFAMGVGQ